MELTAILWAQFWGLQSMNANNCGYSTLVWLTMSENAHLSFSSSIFALTSSLRTTNFPAHNTTTSAYLSPRWGWILSNNEFHRIIGTFPSDSRRERSFTKMRKYNGLYCWRYRFCSNCLRFCIEQIVEDSEQIGERNSINWKKRKPWQC